MLEQSFAGDGQSNCCQDLVCGLVIERSFDDAQAISESGFSCAGSPMVMGRQAYEKMAEERRAEQDAWPTPSSGSKGTAFALNHHVHHVSKVKALHSLHRI